MSIGANESVEDGEDFYRERCTDIIAQMSAELVAARDMSRKEAIATVTQWIQDRRQADDDITGVLGVDIIDPMPNKSSTPAQISAIKAELMDAAREASFTL
jgi:hypothetical protein